MFGRQRQHDERSKEKPENPVEKTDYTADGIENVDDDTLEDPEFPDTEGIGYETLPGGSVMGYIERVNGGEAEACFEFQATRHELKILARYWYREFMEMELVWFSHRTTGSREWRTAKYATRRLARTRRMIGDLVDEVIAEVDAEFRKRIGESEWARFKAWCETQKYSPW